MAIPNLSLVLTQNCFLNIGNTLVLYKKIVSLIINFETLNTIVFHLHINFKVASEKLAINIFVQYYLFLNYCDRNSIKTHDFAGMLSSDGILDIFITQRLWNFQTVGLCVCENIGVSVDLQVLTEATRIAIL